MTEKNTTEQVEWNMAQLLTMEISRLRVEANRAFVQRNYPKHVESIISMKMTTQHCFSKQQRDELQKLEDKIFPLLNITGIETAFDPSKEELKQRAMTGLRKLCMEYDSEVMTLLDRYGFLGDKKKDSSRIFQ